MAIMDHNLDDTVPATAETIIHALSQFHSPGEHAPYDDHQSDHVDVVGDTSDGLQGLSRRQLEDEVLRLRSIVNERPDILTSASHPSSPNAEAGPSRRKPQTGRTEVQSAVLQAETGKRVERNRRTELYRAIRAYVSRQASALFTRSHRELN